MSEFDYNDTEAAHLGDIHSGFESHNMSFEEELAEAKYQRAKTIATLAGLDEDYYVRQKERRKRRKQEIERKDRLLLGTLFLNYVKSENSNIKILEKTSSGQQKYIIINKTSN